MTFPRPDAASSRAIRLEVEAPGTPEEIWESIASGPGIATWFVPATINGEVGGTVALDFGPGMIETLAITEWDPPHRFAYQETSGRDLAYEFTVEARAGGTCIVRLVNSGFGVGDDWDGEYESMTGGWKLFLHMLALSRTHFPGQSCSSAIVNVVTPGDAAQVWATITQALQLPATAEIGEHVAVSGAGVPPLAGTVVRLTPGMMTILLETPAPGAAFVLAEPWRDQTVAGLYLYFFGETAPATVVRDEPVWREWLGQTLPTETAPAEPAPAEPAPVEPAPVEPAPAEPAP